MPSTSTEPVVNDDDTQPVDVVHTTLMSVVTIDDNQWSAIWRTPTGVLDLDRNATAQLLTWLGAITIVFAGVVMAAWLVGPAIGGAPAFLLITVGVGLVLANLVGVFAMMGMVDRRPRSRDYMEHLVASRQVVGPD